MIISLSEAWLGAFAPPDRRPIEEWAAANVTMPTSITKRDPVTGRFTAEGSRHFIAPMQALQHGRVRGVRVCAPVRGGKTLIGDLYDCWAIANDNASVMRIMQDQPIAERHAESRAMPMLKSVPAIQSLLSEDRNKTRKADMLLADGRPYSLQGPATGGLQSRGFQVVGLDECWMLKDGKIDEAKGRLGDALKIGRSKFYAISQGGMEDSEWDLEYKSGKEYVWHIRCLAPNCGKRIAPEWTIKNEAGERAGLRYDEIKHADGTVDDEASAETVRFVCPHCGHVHQYCAQTQASWDKTGEYISTRTGEAWDKNNPATELSFRWTAIIDFPWRELVKLWLKAQRAKHVGNFEPLAIFFQKRMALMVSESQLHDTELPFVRVKAAPPSDQAMPGELIRILTVDRQDEDVFWVMGRAWFDDGRSQRLYFGRLYSFADVEAKREELGIIPDCVVIDSGFKPKGDNGVYAACIAHGWTAAKGVGSVAGFWHQEQSRIKGYKPRRVWKPWAPPTFGDPGMGTAAEGRSQCVLIRFAADAAAETVLELIGAKKWEEPEDDGTNAEMEHELRVQMTAEYPRMMKRKGKTVREFVCPSGNNHAFDCAKMQVMSVQYAGFLPIDWYLTNTDEEAGTAA